MASPASDPKQPGIRDAVGSSHRILDAALDAVITIETGAAGSST